MAKKKFTTKDWERYVRLARKFYLNYQKNRFKIASIAEEACDISKGGRKDERFTIKTFAHAIELNEKTLYEWIRVKRNVVDKLPKRIDIDNIQYRVLTEVCSRVGPATSKAIVTREFNAEMNIDPNIYKWKKYMYKLNALLHNATTPVKLMEIPDSILLEAVDKCRKIASLFEKELEFRKRGTSGAKDMVEKQLDKSARRAAEAWSLLGDR